MEGWKKALFVGSIGAASILFMKKKYPAGVLATGAGLALLASEYPEKFVRIREDLPSYVRQGTRFLDTVMKFGAKIGELAEKRAAQAFEELGEF